MWAPLAEVADASPGSISPQDLTKAARRAVEALTLMVIAYGKAESMHPNPRETPGPVPNPVDWPWIA
jgi:hypothetical protein